MTPRHSVDVYHRKTIEPTGPRCRMVVLNRRVILIAALMILVVGVSLMPAEAATDFGRWRDINPTQYISADASGTLRGVYVAKSGGSASIGDGDGWVVGGDGTTGKPGIPAPVFSVTVNC